MSHTDTISKRLLAILSSVAFAFLSSCGTSPVLEPQIIEDTWATHQTRGTPALWESAFDQSVSENKNRVRMVSRGDEALALRINLIRSARKSIEIQTFIWTNDESGRLIMWELLKAVKQRDVHVRIIADQMFSEQDPAILASFAKFDERLQIQIYNPNANRLAPGALRTLAALTSDFKKVNMRMHNKLMIVDGRVAITGGRNIANEYYDRVIGMNFKDRDALVVGPVVKEMRRSFDEFSKHPWSVGAASLSDVQEMLGEGEFHTYRTGSEFCLNGLFLELEQRASDAAWVERTFTSQLLAVEEVEFIVDQPKKNDDDSLSAGGRITDYLAAKVKKAKKSILIQSPYLTLSTRAIELFETVKQKNPDLRVAVSTNSLAATDSWPTYAASYRQKRLCLDQLGFDIREFKPVPQDIDKMMKYVEVLQRKPTPSERETERRDAFKIDAQLKPFQVKNDDGVKAQSMDRRNTFTGTIPYLCLHQKSMVIDSRIAFIGSYNFDPRSGNLNTEVALVVRDPKFAAIVQRDIETDMLPRNSYRIARRRIPLGLSRVSKALQRVFEALPIDPWPFRFATSFDLKPDQEPVSPNHDDFYANWRDVGSFPLLGFISSKRIFARLFKTFGRGLIPIL